jgi:lipoprotein-releasing system permease protein
MHFYLYFFKYIFAAKTRQKLLFIAVFGLFISSFSLVLLQGIMGGLQNGLMNRSKNVLGSYTFEFSQNLSQEVRENISKELIKNGIKFSKEYEIELMVNHESRVQPVILHGLDFEHFTPDFLKGKDTSGVIIGSDLASSLDSYYKSVVHFISPAHINYLISPIPRKVSEKVTDFFVSELSEIDSLHAWTRITLIQSLIKSREVNKFIFYSKSDYSVLDKIYKNYPEVRFSSWEQENSSLVWALNLETNVMLFLFIGMSLLVAICITSGFMIFFDKIKTDLISYWVLGRSQKSLFKMSYIFTHLLSLVFCSLGLLGGLIFLYALDNFDLNFMPDFFVERRIPVQIDSLKVIISFVIPYSISAFFSYFSFSIFKKETGDFIRVIRSVG